MFIGQQGCRIEMPGIAPKIIFALPDFTAKTVLVWAEVESDFAPLTRAFYIVGTGLDISSLDGWDHVATWLDGPFAWHFYAEGEFAQARRIKEEEASA